MIKIILARIETFKLHKCTCSTQIMVIKDHIDHMNVINNNGLEYCDNEFGRIEIEVRKVKTIKN